MYMKTLRERPLQIYLRPDQDAALRSMAERENVSLAALVRRGIDQMLEQVPVEQDPAMKIIGLGSSGLGDLAENHDKYIVESILTRHSGRTIKPQRKQGRRAK